MNDGRAARLPLQPGDPVPDFECRSTNNPRYAFSTAAGRYLVLCFFGSAGLEKNRKLLELLTSRHRHRFNDRFASFFGVSIDPQDEAQQRVRQSLPGIRHFWDFDRAVSRPYGAVSQPAPGGSGKPVDVHNGFTLILDPMMRVIANLPFEAPERHERAFAEAIEALPEPDLHGGLPGHAPVLVLPRLFEGDFCRELVRLYDEHGGSDSGFMRERDGATIGVMDHSFKRRRDLNMDHGETFRPYRDAIRDRLGARLLPEIKKAFQFNVTRVERFLVACYDADSGGFFRAHRDDTSPATAHRRFAVTINLNAEDYDGGELRFPEFGDRTYRAPTGGAVVFSCSLLHEAMPVTRGRRYACLPFLFDEAGAAIRQRNLSSLTGEVLNLNRAATA